MLYGMTALGPKRGDVIAWCYKWNIPPRKKQSIWHESHWTISLLQKRDAHIHEVKDSVHVYSSTGTFISIPWGIYKILNGSIMSQVGTPTSWAWGKTEMPSFFWQCQGQYFLYPCQEWRHYHSLECGWSLFLWYQRQQLIAHGQLCDQNSAWELRRVHKCKFEQAKLC